MKRNLIPFLLLIVIIGINCKKNAIEPSPGVPPSGKRWVVTTIAGDGRPVFADGAALSASFKLVLDVVVGDDGAVYVADGLSHRIRKISGGQVTTFAGYAVQDTVNGNGAAAGFGIPSRLAMDATGNIYTLDVVDSRVRKISPAGDVSTYAGIIAKGFADGQGSAAKFDQSFGIVSDADGNIYIGDSGNKRIRKINTNAQVSTIAGTGIEGIKDGNRNTAQFFFPEGVVIDKQGNLFVADVNRIRKITPAGIVSTFAGSQLSGPEDGPPGIGRFTLIEDIAIDEHNNLFASDDNLIRKISPDGVVSTIAGSTAGYKDGEGASAKFNVPEGLGIDRQGNIYVADINNHRIRKITFE